MTLTMAAEESGTGGGAGYTVVDLSESVDDLGLLVVEVLFFDDEKN